MERMKTHAVTIIAVVATLFHIYTGVTGAFTGMLQRSIHMGLLFSLCFLVVPASKNPRIRKITDYTDILLVLAVLASASYLVLNYDEIIRRIGVTMPIEVTLGIVTVLLVVEAVRRSCGLILALVTASFLVYAFAGPYLPTFLAHRGYSLARIASQMYLTTEGIFGMPLGVAANYIVLFVVFGEVLNTSGAGKFFMDLAFSMTAWARGGPAKSAIVASGLFGSISGSAVANVTTTGTFTIPLMIRTGYQPVFAAAVETVASTGGLIAPPIMGSAAFLMAEMINVPYISIVKAAVIPTLLYYICLFITIDLQAQKQKLVGVRREELKSIWETLKSGWEFFIPLVTLIVCLVSMWSPAKSVTTSLAVLVAMSMFRKEHRLTPKKLLNACVGSMKGSITISTTCAAAGIIIGVVTLSGLGLRLSSTILQLSGGFLSVALVLTMICSLILGMGMPSSASYIVLAVLAAPTLIELGVPLLSAHFFIFYFGVLSNITPPVALAAFAAASLSKSNAMQVGWKSVKLGIVAFIVPYMCIYGPSLLMVGSYPVIIRSFMTALIGVYAMSVCVTGYFKRELTLIERTLFGACAFLMIDTDFVTDVIGILVLGVMVAYTSKTKERIIAV
jgi:TRAP transporter 4TM/12TM fusion protein